MMMMIIYERVKFHRRRKRESQGVEEFIIDLYSLAKTCDFGVLHEEMIRDRIVVGVSNHRLSRKMQLDTQLTLEKATNLA